MISVVWEAAKCLSSNFQVQIDDTFYRDSKQKRLQKEMMVNLTKEIERGILDSGLLRADFETETKKAWNSDFNNFILNSRINKTNR